jgi:phosphatidylethanolamine-binding protein (PEBP) family uncharacterized protein
LLAVAGCGGSSSSSAPGTAGSAATSTTASAANGKSSTGQGSSGSEQAKVDPETVGQSAKEGQGERQATSNGEGSGKKHPPLSLPEGKPEEGATKAQQSQVPTATIELSVPAAPGGTSPGSLPAAYTCDGKNVAPEVKWGKLPEGTAEAALFVMNMQPVNGKLYFDYAIAGIDPSLEGLKSGEVSKGAVIGRNSAGQDKYSLCPQGSSSEEFIFALYAISKKLAPKAGFDPLKLREEATPVSATNGLYAVMYPGG